SDGLSFLQQPCARGAAPGAHGVPVVGARRRDRVGIVTWRSGIHVVGSLPRSLPRASGRRIAEPARSSTWEESGTGMIIASLGKRFLETVSAGVALRQANINASLVQ